MKGDHHGEAYKAIMWGVGLSYEMNHVVGAEAFVSVEGNMCEAVSYAGTWVTGWLGGGLLMDAVEPAEMAALSELNAGLHGRTAKLRNPHDPSLLAWFAWIVARLGGWSGYTLRGYSPAGPKTMHHGLIQLDRIMLGWSLAHRSAYV